MALLGFLLAAFGPLGNQGQITDDTGGIIQIFTAALGAMLQLVLGNVAAIIADGIGNVEGEVVTAGGDGQLQQMSILILGEMLFQIAMECTAAIQIAGVYLTMETELVDDVGTLILHQVEVRVITITRDDVVILLIPLGVLDAKVFSHSVTFMTN